MTSSHSPLSLSLLVALSVTTAICVTACSSGDVPVGSSQQALQKKKNGSPTGNGTTCSWDDAVSSDGTTTPSASGGYKVGDTFKSLDGCNECSCTTQGIACTERACAPGATVCTFAGKTYTQGQSYYDGCNTCTCAEGGGTSCTTRDCAPACSTEAKLCPNGTAVGRSGPSCAFAPCPTGVACTDEAKQCPDGSYVGRTGPKCEFAPCP